MTRRAVVLGPIAGLIAATMLAPTTGADAQAVKDGLISYWPFDKQHVAGDKVKDIVGGQDAQMFGAAKTVPGKAGEAVELDGSASYLVVTDDIKAAKLPTREMTAEAWVYPGHFIEWGGYIGAFQDNGGFEKGWVLGTNWQISFAVSTRGADDGDGVLTYIKAPPVPLKEWVHVAGTYDGKTMTLYLNGVPAATSGVQSGDILYPERVYFRMGVYKDDNEDFRHLGMLDEVRLYRRALTADEVGRNLKAQGLAVEPGGKLGLLWGRVKAAATR
jgi:hypothetical protein